MSSRVLLYSGGMDSWLIDKLWKPDVKLFFHIGTKNNEAEYERVKNRNDVEIIEMPLSKFEQRENNYYLPLRNLHFITYGAHYGDIICLGATGSSTHRDKNETFSILAENVINYLLQEDDRKVSIVMPFLNMSKTELLALYLANGGDINKCYNETFSCYNPIDGGPCMLCTSCQSKFTAFYNNGYKFSDIEIQRFIDGVIKSETVKPDVLSLFNRLHSNKVVCVDFDNTITEYSKYPNTGSIRNDCKDALLLLKSKGYKIILCTARTGKDFVDAINICKQYGLPIDDYVNNKPFADYYIDDKAITFTDWSDVLKEI